MYVCMYVCVSMCLCMYVCYALLCCAVLCYAMLVSGKVPLALPAIGENGEAKKYPSMPCVTSERIQHRKP